MNFSLILTISINTIIYRINLLAKHDKQLRSFDWKHCRVYNYKCLDLIYLILKNTNKSLFRSMFCWFLLHWSNMNLFFCFDLILCNYSRWLFNLFNLLLYWSYFWMIYFCLYWSNWSFRCNNFYFSLSYFWSCVDCLFMIMISFSMVLLFFLKLYMSNLYFFYLTWDMVSFRLNCFVLLICYFFRSLIFVFSM